MSQPMSLADNDRWLLSYYRAGRLRAGGAMNRIGVLVVTSSDARRSLRLLGAVLGFSASGYEVPHPRHSISHTDRRGVAATATGPAAGIGVDLEHVRPADPRTARFFLRPHEESWLCRASAREIEHVRLWTVKEALFKADLANASRTLRDYAIDEPAALTGLAQAPDGVRFAYASVRRRDTILSIAAAVQTRHSGAAMPKPTTDITFDSVAARLGALLSVPVESLNHQTFLADLAADSYEMVEIVIDLQEEFGVHFTRADLRPVLTLGDLGELLRGQTHAASN